VGDLGDRQVEVDLRPVGGQLYAAGELLRVVEGLLHAVTEMSGKPEEDHMAPVVAAAAAA
jgi:hypothetical protein